MSTTKQQLITALLREGRARLADIWGCDATTAGRKLDGQVGIKLDEFAAALDALGVKIVTGTDVVIPVDEVRALNLLANRYLERRLDGNSGVDGVVE